MNNRVSYLSKLKAKYASDPEAHNKRSKAYREANPDRIRQINADQYQRNKIARDLTTAEWRRKNPEKEAAKAKRWRDANPHLVNAKSSKRRAIQKMAVASWADKSKILQLFSEASRLSEETAIPHEVDHLVPLISPKVQSLDAGNPIQSRSFFGPLIPVVQGLHCEQNMRVATRELNRAKGNKTWPDMPFYPT